MARAKELGSTNSPSGATAIDATSATAVEAENAALRQQLAEAQQKLAAANAANAAYVSKPVENAAPQPVASDVRPGKVWNGKKFVPLSHAPQFKFEVRSPVKTFNGDRAGVHFREGLGGTNDPELALFFITSLGYTVSPLPPGAPVASQEQTPVGENPAE